MIRLIQAKEFDAVALRLRQSERQKDVDDAVSDILYAVKTRGDAALKEYSRRFDGCDIDAFELTSAEIDAAYERTDPVLIDIMHRAAENIRAYHEKQVRLGYEMEQPMGVVLGQRVLPLNRVGIYTPGGTASYPSSVLMNAIPARIAGVHEIVMVTPPGRTGPAADAMLAAARIAGVDRVFRLGGAQAVAALAFGTQSVPQADKIVGPGNAYVASAKRQVYGTVDIDMIAGPSEILVVADGTCDPEYVAADLLSQAEHDKLSAAILCTDSPALAQAVQTALEAQLEKLPRAHICRASIDDNGMIVVCQSIEEAIGIANLVAPEHLELCTDDPFSLLPLVKNAGSVFLGKYAPEALGDYFAGPNQILPTSGTERFSSPLTVDDFVKKSSYLYYTPQALREAMPYVEGFARREGLDAHANSVTIRFEKERQA